MNGVLGKDYFNVMAKSEKESKERKSGRIFLCDVFPVSGTNSCWCNDPSVFLIAWIFYQVIIKKRGWTDMKGDVFAVLFFVTAWIGIAYFFTH